MHPGLKANLPFCRHDPLTGPAPHRLSTQQPHLLDEALLGSVSLLEVALRVSNRAGNRRHSLAKRRMELKKRNCPGLRGRSNQPEVCDQPVRVTVEGLEDIPSLLPGG